MPILVRLAWRNIWRNRRRTWLTLAAIAFGAGLLVFNIGLQMGSYAMTIDNTVRIFYGHLQVQRAGYLDAPKMRTAVARVRELADRIGRVPGVAAAAPRAYGFALASSATRSYGIQVVGVAPRREPGVSNIPGLVRRGRYLSGDHAMEAVVGRRLARNLHLDVGGELTLLGTGRDGSVAAVAVPVAGIFETGSAEVDRGFVEIPLGTFQEVFSMDGAGHAVVVRGRGVAELGNLERRVRAALPPGEDLVVLTWDRLLPGMKELIDLDFASSWFFYAALVVVITFSIMNTFLMSVLERTREFGLLLALGMRPRRIGAMVLLEALVLTLLGLCLGECLGVAVNAWFYVHGFSIPGMEELAAHFNMPSAIRPRFTPFTLGSGPAAVFAAAMLSALYPALRARRLRPLEALKAA